jgi:hypothetical protein
MLRRKLGIAALMAGLAIGLITPTVSAASSGTNSGRPPDNGNCFGNFVNQGSLGFDVSNFGPPAPSGLGRFIGKEEHGCRG